MLGHECRKNEFPFVSLQFPVVWGTVVALSTVVELLAADTSSSTCAVRLHYLHTWITYTGVVLVATGTGVLVTVVRRCFALPGIDKPLLDTSLLTDTESSERLLGKGLSTS